MKILACDTSGPSCSAALLEKGVCLEERHAESPGGHAEVFMPMVRSLLDDHEWTAADVALFACVTGPGSFTGIRTGIAAVQAMAYAAARPAIGVTALDALAYPLLNRPEILVCPVLDARSRRLYTQADRTGTDGKPATRVLLAEHTDTDRLLQALAAMEDALPILFCGSAAEDVAREAALRLGASRILPPAHERLNATWAGQIAASRYGKGPPARFPAHELQPVYLGRSQAERTTGIDISDWKPETGS